jgi:hypothetical protein
MSNNHSHDNIYSILGKLEALKPTTQEKHDATVQQIRESVEAQGSILKGLREVGSVEQRLAKQFAESKIEEKAVSQAQQKFMGMVHAAQKGSKAASPAVAKVAKDMGKKDARDFAATKHKGLPQHAGEGTCNECGMTEGTCEHTMSEDMSRAAKGYEKYGKKGMQALAKAGRDGASEKELDTIRDKHDQYNEATEECCCKELGQKECPVHCDDEPRVGVKEGETTRKDGVTTHRKTDFPGYPSDDLDDSEEDENKGKRGRPRKHAKKKETGEKRGRGRPSKHSTGEKSSKDSLPFSSKNKMGHDPFGRVKKDAEKTVAESMDNLARRLTEGVNFANLLKEKHQTVDEMLAELSNDMKVFKETGHCSELLRDCMEIKGYHGKMTADEGSELAQRPSNPDPFAYVKDAPKPPMGIPGSLPAGQIPGKSALLKGQGRNYYEEDSLASELDELAKLAGLQTSEGNAFTGKLASTPKGGSFELDGKTFKDTSGLGEADMDEGILGFGLPKFTVERDYLSVDSGMFQHGGNQAGGKKLMAALQKANPQLAAQGKHNGGNGPDGFMYYGIQFPTPQLAQQAAQALQGGMEEGNAFSGAVAQAKADGVQPGEKITVGGKEYPVKEEKIDVADAPEAVNKPRPKYASIKTITTQGDDMNREKSQDPATANKAANPFTNKGNRVSEATLSLEAQLAAEYESIKKVN